MENKKIIFPSLTYDKHFRELVEGAVDGQEIGQIHSVFARVINFRGPQNQLYTIGSAESDNSPYTLRIGNRGVSFTELGIVEKTSLRREQNKILIGEELEIGMKTVDLWTGSFERISHISIKAIEKNLKLVDEIIGHQGAPGGCSYYYYKDCLGAPKGPGLMERELVYRIEALMKELRYQRPEVRGIKALIGFGIGLTPSGDDFITGMMAALGLIQTQYTEKILPRMKAQVKTYYCCTTDVSQQMLLAALEGEFKEGILNLIAALISDNPNILRLRLGELLAVGSSSGTDMTIGIVMAFQLIIENFKMEG